MKRPPAEPLGDFECGITFDEDFGIVMPNLQKQPVTKEMQGKVVMS